jgi:hypothetical protein
LTGSEISRRPELPLSNDTRVEFVSTDGVKTIAITAVYRALAVDSLIRLHMMEFSLIPSMEHTFVHFNLEFSTNKKGGRYALVPIVKPGHRSPDGTETLPLLDIGQGRFATCVDVRQHVPFEEVTEEVFALSLQHIRSVDQLRDTLAERYARMFPTRRLDDILRLGCAISWLHVDAKPINFDTAELSQK